MPFIFAKIASVFAPLFSWLSYVGGTIISFLNPVFSPVINVLAFLFTPFARINATAFSFLQPLFARAPWLLRILSPLASLSPLFRVVEVLLAIAAIPYVITAAAAVTTFVVMSVANILKYSSSLVQAYLFAPGTSDDASNAPSVTRVVNTFMEREDRTIADYAWLPISALGAFGGRILFTLSITPYVIAAACVEAAEDAKHVAEKTIRWFENKPSINEINEKIREIEDRLLFGVDAALEFGLGEYGSVRVKNDDGTDGVQNLYGFPRRVNAQLKGHRDQIIKTHDELRALRQDIAKGNISAVKDLTAYSQQLEDAVRKLDKKIEALHAQLQHYAYVELTKDRVSDAIGTHGPVHIPLIFTPPPAHPHTGSGPASTTNTAGTVPPPPGAQAGKGERPPSA